MPKFGSKWYPSIQCHYESVNCCIDALSMGTKIMLKCLMTLKVMIIFKPQSLTVKIFE